MGMRDGIAGRKGCGTGGGSVGGSSGGVAVGRGAAGLVAVVAAITAWTLAALLCLAAPALAFWGDYGPEPRPEIFGVRLGDDIRNYKGMVLRPANYEPHRGAYQRKTDEGLTFAGVPLWGEGTDSRPYYSTYKNKIYRIAFHVRPEDYERAAQKVNAMFGPPRARGVSPVSLEFEYVWMNSEVFVTSDRDGGF